MKIRLNQERKKEFKKFIDDEVAKRGPTLSKDDHELVEFFLDFLIRTDTHEAEKVGETFIIRVPKRLWEQFESDSGEFKVSSEYCEIAGPSLKDHYIEKFKSL